MLKNLHDAFSQANKNHFYINFDTAETYKAQPKKTSSLHEAFEKISSLIQRYLPSYSSPDLIPPDVQALALLKEDGTELYKTYETKSKRWSRSIFRWIQGHSPAFLKKFFPSIFEERIKKAEEATKINYEKYLSQIDQTVEKLNEQEKKIKKGLELKSELKLLTAQLIQKVTANNISPRKFVEQIKAFHGFIQNVKDYVPQEEIKAKLLEDGLPDDVASLFLKGPVDNYYDLVSKTSWKPYVPLQELKEFKVRKLIGEHLVINEQQFTNFKGVISIDPSLLKDLVQFQKSNSNCRPHTVKISFKEDETLDQNMFEAIQTLSKAGVDIELVNLKEMSFSQINLSKEEMEGFINRLSQCVARDLQTIHFPAGTVFTPQQWSVLLQFCPSQALMRQAFNLCSEPLSIQLPSELTQQQSLNLTGYLASHLDYIVNQFKNLKELHLSQSAVTDVQIRQWCQKGLLNQVHTLNVENCSELTTDALVPLASLPSLWTLRTSENLPSGNFPLSELPKISNPFKLFSFYGHPKILRPYARSHYEGPTAWAALFQIPLARLGHTPVFSSQDKILDPQSVALWLFANDFRELKQEPNVETILADNREEINDSNLLEFVLKFPNLTELSLYRCPNITDKGVQTLLDNLGKTKLKNIDLTGCRQVTTNVLFNVQGGIATLKQLKVLDLSDTQMIPDLMGEFKEKLSCIRWVEKTLRVTDALLKSEGGIKKLLDSKDLSKLVRLDFEGCQELTDEDLSFVLKHLNEPIFVAARGGQEENTRRLNIIELNLTGCVRITDQAFQVSPENPKDLQILNSLHRIAVAGTKLSPKLKEACPHVNFSETLQLVGERLNRDTVLAEIEAHYKKEKLSTQIVFNRMALQIFAELFKLPPPIQELLSNPFDPSHSSSGNFNLALLEREDSPFVSFCVQQNLLYSLSSHFRELMRPGGHLYRNNSVTLVNQNASLKAVKAFLDLLHGKEVYNQLDWQTAAKTAELVSQNTLKLPSSFYERLVKRAESEFTLVGAEDMFLQAYQLKDRGSFRTYERLLLALLEINPLLVGEVGRLTNQYQEFMPQLHEQVITLSVIQAHEDE